MRCWYVNEFCAWHTKSTICSNSHASFCDLLTLYYYLELNSFFLFNISKLSRWSQNGKPFLMYPFQYLFLVYKGISLVLFQKSYLLCLYQKYELSHSRACGPQASLEGKSQDLQVFPDSNSNLWWLTDHCSSQPF